MKWLWVPGVLRVPEAPELLVAGLPVMRLPAVELPVAGALRLPAAGLLAGLPGTALPVGRALGLPGAALAAPELPEAVAADAAGAVAPGAADLGDPPEARSCCDPAPAAGAVGCSEVAGGRASVEVDLSACVGF